MFPLWLRQLPWCGDWTPASVSPPAEGRSSPSNTPVFPPSSFILPSFAWVYIFFSAGQGLLSSLSWRSACNSVSEGVFLMYPWREMSYMSIYSSTILFSWMLSFQPAFSSSSFTFFKKLFSSSPLSAIRVVSSAYPKLLIFLLAIFQLVLHPALHFVWCTLHIGKINRLTI